jgi:rare lipoprotein A
MASWYGRRFHGRRTASGERYNMNALTAAHRTLPFGTRVRVERLDNGRHVVVRINDRGPFVKGRVIDLSREAARRLGILGAGVASVRVVTLPIGSDRKSRSKRVTRYIEPSLSGGAGRTDRPVATDRSARWYVYVGKFRKQKIAKRFAERMRKEQLATRVVPSWHRVPKYFHVHIKGFLRKKRAAELVSRLKRQGYNAYVVKGQE